VDEFTTTKQMLEQVFAENDAATRDYEQWQAKQQQLYEPVQQQDKPWLLEDCPAGIDDRKAWWLARQRRAIAKEQQSLRQQPQQQNGVTTMDPVTQAPWDTWCDSRADVRIEKFLEETYSDVVIEFVVEWTNKKVAPLREEIAKLREEIALLRTEQEHNSKGGERSGSSGLLLVRDHRHA
jgi:hypothetical protein